MAPEPTYVPADDAVVLAATAAIQGGDVDALALLLADHPWLTTARFGEPGCFRTVLHVATDWPGHFPHVRTTIERLVAAGAEVSAASGFDAHHETPLHWAASSNDVAALDALLDAGADIEAPGAVLGGGTALADACGFANWEAARRLVERGAQTRLKDAAALGLVDRVRSMLGAEPAPTTEVTTMAIWSACHGGQLAAAQLLAEHGADLDWVGWDDLTPLDVAEQTDAPELVAWLRSVGAHRAAELAP